MYSRCDYPLFVYFLILPSLLHSSILFLYLFLFFFIALSVIYQCHLMVCSQLLKMGGVQNSLPRPSLTYVHNINNNNNDDDDEQDDKEGCFRRPK